MGRRRGILATAAATAAIGAGTGQASAAVPHTVQPGESLWSISAAHNLTTRTVAVFNGLAEDAHVAAGQTVQVPTPDEGAVALAAAPAAPADSGAPAASGAGHVVVAGESLSAVAAAHGVSVSDLAAANGRPADAFLLQGETLSIPAVSAPVAAGSSTAGMGHIPSPYGELHLAPDAADSWNAMRGESLRRFGQDLHPGGPLSAHRTYEQQSQLYDSWLRGDSPPAAVPGTSAHERGAAVDVETPQMRSVIDQIGAAFGWGKVEAPDEWWHVNYAP